MHAPTMQSLKQTSRVKTLQRIYRLYRPEAVSNCLQATNVKGSFCAYHDVPQMAAVGITALYVGADVDTVGVGCAAFKN